MQLAYYAAAAAHTSFQGLSSLLKSVSKVFKQPSEGLTWFLKILHVLELLLLKCFKMIFKEFQKTI